MNEVMRHLNVRRKIKKYGVRLLSITRCISSCGSSGDSRSSYSSESRLCSISSRNSNCGSSCSNSSSSFSCCEIDSIDDSAKNSERHEYDQSKGELARSAGHEPNAAALWTWFLRSENDTRFSTYCNTNLKPMLQLAYSYAQEIEFTLTQKHSK